MIRRLIHCKFIMGLVLFLGPISILAQSTTVTGTIVDQGSVTWSNAQITITLQAPANINGPFTWSGGAYNAGPQTIYADGAGHFSISLPTISAMSNPALLWRFVIAPNASVPAIALNIATTGGTQDISSAITAAAPAITGIASVPVPRAYTTGSIMVPPNMGGIVFNTTTGMFEYWDGSTWSTLTTGTASPVGPASGDLSGTYPGPTVSTAHITSGNIGGATTIFGVNWTEEVLAFTATPTFSNTVLTSIITMTGNITSMVISSGLYAGQPKVITFCQDGVGNHTATGVPSNVRGFFLIGATASKCSSQTFVWSTNQSAWMAQNPGVTNF